MRCEIKLIGLVAFKQEQNCDCMPNSEKSKKADNSDPMTDLLRQMGLCEDEIKGALDLADKIEKKVEVKGKPEIIPTDKFDNLTKDALIQTVKEQNSQLAHFYNVVAPQFILMIKKYKDRVLKLEDKLQKKNKQIEELSLKLEFLLK